MKFKIDENLPIDVAQALQQAGHDAKTVIDQKLGGAPDRKVAVVCKRERRILLTLDTDFADIRTYPPESYFGIIVFRLGYQDKVSILNVLTNLLSSFSGSNLERKLWIVEEERIRIRG